MARMRELMEVDAVGEIAVIYEEIRKYYAAPYVSSLFRHLATYPGLLEWVWRITRPVFESGLIQNTGWSRVDVSGLEGLKPLSNKELNILGVNSQARKIICNTCLTFTRVSPINLVFAGCMKQLLEMVDRQPVIKDRKQFPLPAPLPKLPSMVPWEDLTAPNLAALHVFSATLAGEIFVPGIYRIFARWPLYLEYVAELLGPRLSDPNVLITLETIANNIFSAVPEVFDDLDLTEPTPPIDEEQKQQVLSAITAYRGTSPQMVGFGTLLMKALPVS
jgi:hypothetical protein